MAKQGRDDQLEQTYSSYMRIRDEAPKTSRRRWMIGRSSERGSVISVLAARRDDDDDTYGEMVDFGESKKMVKIIGNADKSNTYNGFSGNIFFFMK